MPDNVTILVAATREYWPLMTLTAPNRLEYCLKHQYALVTRIFTPITSTAFHYEREEFILDTLKTTDWLLFMGCDTCFTNMNIDLLEQLIGRKSDTEATTKEPDIVYGVCKEGTAGIVGLNNDVVLFKNCPAVVEFLQAVIALRHFFPNDQAAMKMLLDASEAQYKTTPNKPGLLYSKPVPQKLLNSMPQWLYGYKEELKVNGLWDGQWTVGDFIFHAPGMDLKNRLILMAEVLKYVVR